MTIQRTHPYDRRGQPIKKARIYAKVRKKPPVICHKEVTYDFLKWIRVVFKWAKEHSGLNRPELEMLLYLYPIGPFTKAQFIDYHNTIGYTMPSTWKDHISNGWIREWRSGKRNMKGLFDLTSKAKIVCSKMHQMCVGDMDVPTSRRSNPLNRQKDVKVNAHYTKLFKQMNAERAEKLNKKEEEEN